MAEIVNDRDLLIMAASTRFTPPTDRYMILTPPAAIFRASGDGSTSTPPSFTFKATLLNMAGVVSFAASNGAKLTVSAVTNEATLDYAAYLAAGAEAIYITATITVDGAPYAQQAIVTKVSDGAQGADGAQTAVARLYQFSTTVPVKPTGGSTFTWAGAWNGAYTGTDGWGVTVPANPGTPGLRLYVASVSVSGAAKVTTTPVTYTGATVEAWTQNGAAGASGVNTGSATVYQWAATIPAGPTGSALFRWASNSFGEAPSGWSLAPLAAPAVGMTLWAARVQLLDTATNGDTAFNWSSAAIMAIGYAGTNGGNGAEGASYVTAYCASSTMATSTAPGKTSGKSSVPAPNSGGIVGAYTKAVPALANGQFLYQSDGIYDPATNEVTWSIPYWSSLKVATLSAISANFGAMTAGSIDLGSGSSSWHVDTNGNQWVGANTIGAAPLRIYNTGAMVALNLTLQNGAGQEVIGPNGLRAGFEAPGTKNSEAIATAATDAQARADAARIAAENAAATYAQAQAGLAATNAAAYADGKVTAAEQRAINDASTKAEAARVAAVNAAATDASVKAESARVAAVTVKDLYDGTHFGARNRNDPPGDYPVGISRQFKDAAALGIPGAPGSSYCTLETTIQYLDASGGACYQYCYWGVKTYRRTSNARSDQAWTGAWVQDLDRNAYTGDLNASSDITLVASSGIVLEGNTATRPVGGVWDQQVYSRESYVGGAYVSGRIGSGGFMIGLNGADDLTDASFTTLDHAFYTDAPSGNLYVYRGGNTPGVVSTWAVGDTLAIIYDGAKVSYQKNGVEVNSLPEAFGKRYFFDSSFAGAGAKLTGMRFGPMSGKLKQYRVVAAGNDATGLSLGVGFYQDSLSATFTGVPMYKVVIISRATGLVANNASFQTLGQPAQAAAMANFLNNHDSNYIVVIYSSDEPQGNRLDNGLADAMYRCGASRAVFGSPAFEYRSAYILVGIPGCGEGGAIVEAYQGGGARAWCDIGFTVDSMGNCVGTGSNSSRAIATVSSSLTEKLNKSGTDVITGTIGLQSQFALLVGNYNDGIFIGSTGIYGRKGGYTQFGLGSDGTAIYSGMLSAAYGSFGDLRIANGGCIASGNYYASRGYSWPQPNEGGGIFIGESGILLGNAQNGNIGYFQVDTNGTILAPGFKLQNRQLTLENPIIVSPTVNNPRITQSFSASMSDVRNLGVATGTVDTYIGVSLSGGSGDYSYTWTISGALIDLVSSPGAATAVIRTTGSNNTWRYGFASVTVRDRQTGLSAVADCSIAIQHGSGAEP